MLHCDWLHPQSDPLLVCRPLGCIVVACLSVHQPLHRAASQPPGTPARGARGPRRDAPAAGHPITQRSSPTPKARTRQAPCDHGDVAAAGLPGQGARKALPRCGGLPTAEGLGGHPAIAVVPPLLASPAQGRARHSPVAVRLPLLPIKTPVTSRGVTAISCAAAAAPRRWTPLPCAIQSSERWPRSPAPPPPHPGG